MRITQMDDLYKSFYRFVTKHSHSIVSSIKARKNNKRFPKWAADLLQSIPEEENCNEETVAVLGLPAIFGEEPLIKVYNVSIISFTMLCPNFFKLEIRY